MKLLSETSSLLNAYDAYLIDIWGTLYDGAEVFPEAIEFIKTLRTHGKTVFLVSNAPRRASRLMDDMKQRGVTPDLYDRIVTSGEDLFETFMDPNARYHTFGRTLFHIGIPEHNVWEGTDFRSVSFMREASFVLATSLLPGLYQLEEYSDLFAEALMLDLPMVCANPDQFVVHRNKKIWCAGKLASLYTNADGRVYWHGKPIQTFYQKTLALLDPIDPARVLMIGDGVETDVRGARLAGIDSLFLASGMFGEELGITRTTSFDPDHHAQHFETWLSPYGVKPTYVASSLSLS